MRSVGTPGLSLIAQLLMALSFLTGPNTMPSQFLVLSPPHPDTWSVISKFSFALLLYLKSGSLWILLPSPLGLSNDRAFSLPSLNFIEPETGWVTTVPASSWNLIPLKPTSRDSFTCGYHHLPSVIPPLCAQRSWLTCAHFIVYPCCCKCQYFIFFMAE